MGEIALFTWNLHGKADAHDLALGHLLRSCAKETIVACLQELPGKSSIAFARRKGNGTKLGASLRVVESNPLVRGLALVHHEDLRLDRVLVDPDKEFLAAEFILPSSTKRLGVVGLHAKSKSDMRRAEEHGGSRALLRHAISALQLNCDHLVVLGDFNSPFGAQEIQSWHCFYALAPGSEAVSADTRGGYAHKALHTVPPENAPALGTFRWSDSGSTKYETIDFIAVDAATRTGASSKIMTSIQSRSLLDLKTSKPTPSDHLPVSGTINI